MEFMLNEVKVNYILPRSIRAFNLKEDLGKNIRICYKLTNNEGVLPPGAYKEVSMDWFMGLEDKYKYEMINIHGLSVIINE